ncbi:MAG: hypothetical protein A2860_00310 [Candidatus Levybacteria bacterium RIFCSPHIGHO2_01_FULL_37_33]|nr:MAG: hypothetical protein A2860_00310 [Candidatus Levybacteria bacterium RIFCSPHIGHO2_01_FULL_37_33]OGH17122.1 MAG: hypothetical protein A3C97_00750 [Candidatus Levybacteria bacterium RIFCSPHIGHO2_02_FULL_37_11]OGH29838.1 MAG: hypothetical protein A3F30_00265 [Candidatus Levybacteria bacterium RIFCSPHIGHO2_12_FULL_37_12]OGH32894.1 MAG: hypothetical protein A2953_02005 [Candidatus Levybacteria bacterium RIFCSPLOWO2_01_FULL_36_54]
MTDVFSVKKRREIMSKIRGKNTGLEKIGYSMLDESKVSYIKHPKGIYGNPDAANKKLKIAIFFDSNFWHGFNYYKGFHKKLPNDYWHKKIQDNIKRDLNVNSILFTQGWTVIRFWEHDMIKNKNKCFLYLTKALKSASK